MSISKSKYHIVEPRGLADVLLLDGLRERPASEGRRRRIVVERWIVAINLVLAHRRKEKEKDTARERDRDE